MKYKYKEEIDMSSFAVAYCRKSEEDKKRQVLSIDNQIDECNQLIDKHNLTLTTPHFKEEKSGRKPGIRTEFYKMLNLLKAEKAKVIVCWSANRLARNVIDGGEILHLVQYKGLKIITPYTQYDDTNWFMLMFEFGMSTDFSIKLSKDVKRGLATKVLQGYKPGIAPLGYKNFGEIKGEKTIIPDPKRFKLVKQWWEMIISGQYTVEQSLEVITKLGLRDKKGGVIPRNTAFRLFHNIFYAGWFNYQGEEHKGKHDPMVTRADFNKVQRIISGKFGGKYEEQRERKPLPLSGFIKCGECGATITADRKIKNYKNGTAQEFAWYRCKKNKGVICTQKAYLAAEDLDNQIRTYISNLELDKRFIEWVRKVLKRRNNEEFISEYKSKELLTKRLHDIDERKQKLFDMKIDELYSEEEYKTHKANLLKEEADIKEQLKTDRISYWEKVIDETLDFSSKVMELFNSGDAYTKRMVLQILGSDLKLKDKKLYLEAKSVFVFLRDTQNQLLQENNLVGLKDDAIKQSKQDSIIFSIPLGADYGNKIVHFAH